MAKMPMPPMADDEGSPADMKQDAAGAAAAGMSPAAFEGSPQDMAADQARAPARHHRGGGKHRAPLHGGHHPGHEPSGQHTHHGLNAGAFGGGYGEGNGG